MISLYVLLILCEQWIFEDNERAQIDQSWTKR